MYVCWYDNATMEDRVAVSAALLDQKCPGWVYRVDLVALDMESDAQSVLGQLFGTCREGCGELGITGVQSQHGFTTRYVYEDPAYLTRLWRKTVLSRRSRWDVV